MEHNNIFVSDNLKSLIKIPTCCKNPESPSCIDLILTNKTRNFQNLCVTETSLSDFHKIMVTALRMQFRKLKSRVLLYRDYKHFSNESFINPLPFLLMKMDFRIFSKFPQRH